MMTKMRTTRLILGFVALAAASCTFERLPPINGGDDDDGPISLELLAGDIGGAGNLDGAGPAARFRSPTGVAVDLVGNVYVADQTNHTIRKVSPAGVVTTLAGTAGFAGSFEGTGAGARFNRPSALAVDKDGNVYVADRTNHTIRKITAAGAVSTFAGAATVADKTDGPVAMARFTRPFGVAVDSTGTTVYVADTGNNTIRKITGGVVSTLAGLPLMTGSTDGGPTVALFNDPIGIALDSAGNLYVADQSNHTIRKVTPTGDVSTPAGKALVRGNLNGSGAEARFNFPTGVVVDSEDNVYVTDLNNHTLRKVTFAGATVTVTTAAGVAGIPGATDGTTAAARFNFPTGVAIDGTGKIYVADSTNTTIRKVAIGEGVTTLAGTPGLSGAADGTGAAARFLAPSGIAVDNANNVYVADRSNHTLRKITPDGVVTTLAGTATMGGNADGTGAAARFGLPVGMAVDGAGNVYTGESDNAIIRKITPEGVVTTLAGTATMHGTTDAAGVAARFGSPFGLAIDGAGNLHVADGSNKSIRKITPDGVVTTLVSNAGFSDPFGIAVDGAGNVYVSDDANDTIRKATTDGVVTTLAGGAGLFGSTDGTGAAARFSNPGGVAVDSAGNVYVADSNNSTVRKVTPEGVVTTIAGVPGSAAIVLGETPRFAFPQHLAIVGDSLVITDNNAILLLRHGAR
jgi:DNA-binding beta-propeller fold protein YncE